ncbi:hypothetical protein ACLKA7_001897 [Drosophila subpalustris]
MESLDAETEQPIADLPANTEVNAIKYPENESLANEPVLVDSEKTSGELLLQECVGESEKRRSTSPFGKTRRVRWTIEEKQEMIEIFGDLKSLQKLPSLQECLQIIRNSKNLRERTPAQLKTWLDNQRKSESRKLK